MKRPVTRRRRSPRAPERGAPTASRDEIAQARAVLDALIAFLEDARRSLDGASAPHDGPYLAANDSLQATLQAALRASLLEHASGRPAPADSVPGEAQAWAEAEARALCDLINDWI